MRFLGDLVQRMIPISFQDDQQFSTKAFEQKKILKKLIIPFRHNGKRMLWASIFNYGRIYHYLQQNHPSKRHIVDYSFTFKPLLCIQ